MRKKRILTAAALLVLLVPAIGSFTGAPIVKASAITQVPSVPNTAPQTPVGPRASGNYLVWNQRATVPSISASAADVAAYDNTYHIAGLNLQTNTPFTITSGPGNQSDPAISGSIVLWEDNGHSCASCEFDIMGEDLATGITFSVATGPNDQLYPAISGQTAAWVESDGISDKLLTKNLTTGVVTQVTSLDRSAGFAIYRPVLSTELLVWSEKWQPHRDPTADSGTDDPTSATAASSTPASLLRSYNLSTGQISTVAQFYALGTDYGVADHRIVWSDPDLHFADLQTGESTVLVQGDTMTPQIVNDTIVWSGRSTWGATNYDLWGLKFGDRKPLPLVTDTASKLNPVVVGDKLIWQNDGGDNDQHLATTSLADAFTTGPDRLAAVQQRQSDELAAANQPTPTPQIGNSSTSAPTIKGIHAANGNGWNNNDGTQCHVYNGQTVCPAIDALGAAQDAPYFGAVTVLDSDMGRPTFTNGERPARWGPDVAHAMRTLQSLGTRVILRTWPTKILQPGITAKVDDVRDQVIATAWRDWLRHVQINNEPNIEWPSQCNAQNGGPCRYTYLTQTKSYSWDNAQDYRFYDAIAAFYLDAWSEIQVAKQSYPNINLYTIWSPPMADCYCYLNSGDKPYARLQTMIVNYYRNFTYHLYSDPKHEGNGHGINNASYRWFTTNMQTYVDNNSLPNQVTEMGWTWDQGGMAGCRDPNPPNPGYTLYSQDSVWLANNPLSPGCNAVDGRNHTFANDIAHLENTGDGQRHNAQAMNVWMVRGSSWAQNAIHGAGEVSNWFHLYQTSSPLP